MNFTHEKPTVPGAYWFRYNSSSINHISHVWSDGQKLRVEMWNVECNLDELVTGEWSERLVPVGEVQIAFVEGACAARHWSHLKSHELWDSGVKIRARRVVEGKEEM